MQEELQQLTLGFSTPPDYFEVSVEEFYQHAVDNLKATFANLERVRLEGGYIYRPENESVSFKEYEKSMFSQKLMKIDVHYCKFDS